MHHILYTNFKRSLCMCWLIALSRLVEYIILRMTSLSIRGLDIVTIGVETENSIAQPAKD